MKILNMFKTPAFSKKLKLQLIVSVLLITFIIMMIGFMVVYYIVIDLFKKQNETFSLQMFRNNENNLTNTMNEVDTVTKLIIADPFFQKFIRGQFYDDLDFIETKVNIFNSFFTIMKSYTYIDSIISYGEDGTILGTNAGFNDYVKDEIRVNSFYGSDLYQNAKKQQYKIVWAGNGALNPYRVEINRKWSSNKSIISAARLIQGSDGKTGETTLVININEKKFSSQYQEFASASTTQMYIIDDFGKIISNPDKELIGKDFPYVAQVQKDKEYGTFTVLKEKSSYQIVYYKMKRNGWIMINEIPIGIFLQYSAMIRNSFFFIFCACILAIFALSLYWIFRLTNPLNELVRAMKKMEAGQLGVTLNGLPENELGVLGRQFNNMSSGIAELVQQSMINENRKKVLEIEALQMQINPHFLFNSLNVIKWMAVIANNKNIEEGITSLGNTIKPLFRDASPMWPIQEEISYLEHYLKIINLRYGDSIRVSQNIPSNLMSHKIIKFSLQPLIENAFIHGFKGGCLKMNIALKAELSDRMIIITVKDDGVGMQADRLAEVNEVLNQSSADDDRKTGLGMMNVDRRIKLYFGEEYGLSINSHVGSGTEILVKFPYEHA